MNSKKGENFFKSFGLGLVYTLVFPLIVIGSLLYGLYGLLQWIIVTSKGLVRFFKGDRFFPPLREDKEVALLLKRQHEAIIQGNPIPTPAPTPKAEPAPAQNNVYVQNNYYSTNQKKPETETPSINNENQGYIEGNAAYVPNPSIPSSFPNQAAIPQNGPQQAIPTFSAEKEPRLMEIPSFSPIENNSNEEQRNMNPAQGGNPNDIH